MSQFPKNITNITRDEAINAILLSIADGETALSKLIDAEREKIKYVLDCAKIKGCSEEELEKVLAVNESAANLMNKIVDIEIVLKNKLALIAGHGPKPRPPVPPHPPVPPCKCTSVFISDDPCRVWKYCKILSLREKVCCKNGVRLCQRSEESLIVLPGCKKIKIDFELKALNKKLGLVNIEAEFRKGREVVHKEKIRADAKRNVDIHSVLNYETIGINDRHTVAFRLCSPESLQQIAGKVSAIVSELPHPRSGASV